MSEEEILTKEALKKNWRAYCIVALLGALGLAVVLVLANLLSGLFGEASSESNLAYQIGSFLVGLTVVVFALVALIKYVFPNTLGRDFGQAFNDIWNHNLTPRDKFWAMLATSWVILYVAAELFVNS